jgi:hypothetical protein
MDPVAKNGVNRLAGIDKPVAWFISDRNRGGKARGNA